MKIFWLLVRAVAIAAIFCLLAVYSDFLLRAQAPTSDAQRFAAAYNGDVGLFNASLSQTITTLDGAANTSTTAQKANWREALLSSTTEILALQGRYHDNGMGLYTDASTNTKTLLRSAARALAVTIKNAAQAQATAAQAISDGLNH